jgi:hypothetical protein
MESNELSNESKIAHAEIRAAVEVLIRAATKNKAAVVGFCFGVDPALFIRFGNVKESGPALAALYLKLSDYAEERETGGKVIEDRIEP